jgi:hypothetical protein
MTMRVPPLVDRRRLLFVVGEQTALHFFGESDANLFRKG